MKKKQWTYKKAGVDIHGIRRTQADVSGVLERTFKLRAGKLGKPQAGIGHYAGLIELGGSYTLAVHTDGCGTKVLIAQMMNKYDTIGIDCVAMCVNDVVCVGAEPLALLDYLALERHEPRIIRQVMKGLEAGAKEAGVAIVGGETAIMPNVIAGIRKGIGFDLAGFCVGITKKDAVTTGEKIQAGDIIVGLESSGIHSNGLTLARKVLFEEANMNVKSCPKVIHPKTVGDELLTPTRIYVKQALTTLRNTEVHGLAHITGGAFTKLKRFWRYADVGFHLDNLPPPPPIFQLIQNLGNVPLKDMYTTFNMGVGFCIIAPRHAEAKTKRLLSGEKARVIGKVTAEKEIRLSSQAFGEMLLD